MVLEGPSSLQHTAHLLAHAGCMHASPQPLVMPVRQRSHDKAQGAQRSTTLPPPTTMRLVAANGRWGARWIE